MLRESCDADPKAGVAPKSAIEGAWGAVPKVFDAAEGRLKVPDFGAKGLFSVFAIVELGIVGFGVDGLLARSRPWPFECEDLLANAPLELPLPCSLMA